MRTLGVSITSFVAVLGLVACSDSAPPAPSSAAASSSGAASASSPVASAERVPHGSDEIQPVYPKDGKPPEPFAQRYCDAVQVMPADRKAICCGGTKGSAPFAGECVRTLSSALRSKALVIDEAALAGCEAKMKVLHEGCAWVGARRAPLPPECSALFQGTLSDGAVCRSSLECKKGLTCYGLSAIGAGKCSAPKPKDVPCNTGTETLATLTFQDPVVAVEHPTCAGRCSHRCVDAVEVGGACKGASDCGLGRSCVDGKCTDKSVPQKGEACATGECALGLRCIGDKCQEPALEGVSCSQDAECIGTCVDGACAKACGGGGPRPSLLPVPSSSAPPSASAKAPASASAKKR